MRREDLSDLAAMRTVVEEQSFTRAAVKLGSSQSQLSHTIKRLEQNLGLRLIERTTRSMAPTAAGDRLLRILGPALDELDHELETLGDLRDKPAGTIRIYSMEHAVETLVWPRLAPLLKVYPDINVEITLGYGPTDIVAERFDAGIHLGEEIQKDMIAVPIGPDFKVGVYASPGYLADNAAPTTPHDLVRHQCINLRLSQSEGFYPWEFSKRGRELKVRVNGRFAFNSIEMMKGAALEGFGLAYLPQDTVEDAVAKGQLVSVLKDWCTPVPGYHLYYASRHHASAAFRVLVDALRHPS